MDNVNVAYSYHYKLFIFCPKIKHYYLKKKNIVYFYFIIINTYFDIFFFRTITIFLFLFVIKYVYKSAITYKQKINKLTRLVLDTKWSYQCIILIMLYIINFFHM